MVRTERVAGCRRCGEPALPASAANAGNHQCYSSLENEADWFSDQYLARTAYCRTGPGGCAQSAAPRGRRCRRTLERAPSRDNPLLYAKNCLVTPHIAWAKKEGRGRLIDTAATNLKAFLQGHQKNVVN